MKAVMITLSGDREAASNLLKSRFPDVEIEAFPRARLESGSFLERLFDLRRARPNIFVVVTEAVAWQYGQDALMLFGALAGARQSLIIDARGTVRAGKRAALLTQAPFRIVFSIARGKAGVRKGRISLVELETKVAAASPPAARVLKKNAVPIIAYLRATPAPGTQPGGAASHINGVVNALVGLGAKISFISNDEIIGLDKNKVSFQKIQPDPNVMPRSAFDIYNGSEFSQAAAELVAESPPDFIYQRYSRFSWAGVEASRRAKVPLFLEYNGSEVWIGKHWDKTSELPLLERYELLNLRAATRIFVISDVERDNLLSVGVPGEKIIVNPNGVDSNEFRPGIGGEHLRQQLKIAQNVVLIGFVGTFGPWHGVLALADAIALTSRQNDIHFLLIGDGSLRTSVEDKLRDSGDLDRVTFAGVVTHGRVPIFLDACDILVSPHVPLADGSDFFGSPTKLFEYMAMEKGIVASRLGQIGDVLSDKETALLVEPGNANELSGAIQKLANDPALLVRLGKAARSVAVAKHTWIINGRRVLEEFQGLSA